MSYKFSYTSLPTNYFDRLGTKGGVACTLSNITNAVPGASITTPLVPGVWEVIANFNNIYFGGNVKGQTMSMKLEAQNSSGNIINPSYDNTDPSSTSTSNGPIFNPFTNGYVVYGGGVTDGTPYQISGIFHINKQNWKIYAGLQDIPNADGGIQEDASPHVEIMAIRIA